MNLTRRQREIYNYLVDNAGHFDHPPTLDELCEALGLASRGSLHKHIQALVRAGLVQPMDGSHRGIRLVFLFTLINGLLGRTIIELLPALPGGPSRPSRSRITCRYPPS